MLIWENSDLFCDVWWWWGVGLITPHTRQRDTVTVAESDNPSQNGINFDHWSLNNCPLSQKTSSQARHLSSAIAVIVTVTRFMSSLSLVPSVVLLPPIVKVSDYHPPPSPGKPFCIRKRDAGLRFPGTTPASAPEDRIRSPVSPHPLRRVTLFVTHRPRLTTRWHRL